VPAPQNRICQLAEDAAVANDAETALRRLTELRDELVAFERTWVSQALRSGSSFGDVAKVLGISRQAAHRRYRDLAPPAGKPMSLSSHARRAVQLAREEAVGAGARTLRSEHLLLGVLRSGGPASSALEARGITAETARESLRARNEAADEEEVELRRLLTEATKIARQRHARCVDVEHIALAAIDGHPTQPAESPAAEPA
jgi:hypothetical protein